MPAVAVAGLVLLVIIAAVVSADTRTIREFSVGVMADDPAPTFDLTWNVTALNLTGQVDYENSSAYVQVKAVMRMNPSGVLGASYNWRVLHDGVAVPNCEGSILRAAGQGNEIPYVELDCPFTPHEGSNTLTFEEVSSTNVLFVRGSLSAFEVHTVLQPETLTIQTSFDQWVPYLFLGALFVLAVRAQAVGVAFVAVVAILLTAAGNPWPVAAVATFGIATALVWAWPHMKAGIAARKRGGEA